MKRVFLLIALVTGLGAMAEARREQEIVRGEVTSNTLRGKSDLRRVNNPLTLLEGIEGLQYYWETGAGQERDIMAMPTRELATTMPELLEWEIPGRVAAGMRMDRVGVLTLEAVKELGAVVDELCGQVLHLAQDLARVTEQLAEHERRLGRHESEIEQLEQRITSQERALAELRTKNAELERANQRQDAAIARLEAQMAALMAGL